MSLSCLELHGRAELGLLGIPLSHPSVPLRSRGPLGKLPRWASVQECCWSRAWGWAPLHSAAEKSWVLLLIFCWPCRNVTSCPLPNVLSGTHSPGREGTQLPLGANSGFGAVAFQVTGSSIRVYCRLLTNWQPLSWWSVCEYPTESLILFHLPVGICCPRHRASYCTLCVWCYGYSSSM